LARAARSTFSTCLAVDGSCASVPSPDPASPIYPLTDRRLYALALTTNGGQTWSSASCLKAWAAGAMPHAWVDSNSAHDVSRGPGWRWGVPF
jgi:hypothetical protein